MLSRCKRANARGRALLDVLGEARVDIRQRIDPALLKSERALQIQLDKKELWLAKPFNKDRAALEKEISSLVKNYLELQAEIKIKSPRYAELKQPQPVNLKKIQQLLDADTLLLEYSFGNENTYLWVVSQNDLKTFRLPKRAQIESKARLFYDSA